MPRFNTILVVAASILLVGLDTTQSAMAPIPTVSSTLNAVRSSDTMEFTRETRNGLLQNVRSYLRKVSSFSSKVVDPVEVPKPYVKKLKRMLDKILPPLASSLVQLSDWHVQIIKLNLGLKPNKEPKSEQLTQLSLLLLWRMNYFITNSKELSKETQNQGTALVRDIVNNKLARTYFGWYVDGKRNKKHLNKELLTHAFTPKTTRDEALSLLPRARAYIMTHLKPLFYPAGAKPLDR